MDLALRATCDPGDEVILHEPSYVAYVPAIVFAGGTVVPVATRFDDDFALDPAAVEAAITPRTKALFLGYPANPTGAVLDDDVQDELARIARDHDLLVYSDEIYDRLAYGTYRHRAFSSLPGMRERTILMGGFSKAYAMTGWRVGWVCAPARDPRGHRQGPPVRDHVRADGRPGRGAGRAPGRRRRRRDRWSRSTTAAGACWSTASTSSACRPSSRAARSTPSRDITSTGLTSDEFTEQLLREEQVAVVPGTAFGAVGRGPRPHVLRDLVRDSSRRRSCASPASWSVTGQD